MHERANWVAVTRCAVREGALAQDGRREREEEGTQTNPCGSSSPPSSPGWMLILVKSPVPVTWLSRAKTSARGREGQCLRDDGEGGGDRRVVGRDEHVGLFDDEFVSTQAGGREERRDARSGSFPAASTARHVLSQLAALASHPTQRREGKRTRRSAPCDLCAYHPSKSAESYEEKNEKSCVPISSVSPMDPPGVGGAQRQKSFRA